VCVATPSLRRILYLHLKIGVRMLKSVYGCVGSVRHASHEICLYETGIMHNNDLCRNTSLLVVAGVYADSVYVCAPMRLSSIVVQTAVDRAWQRRRCRTVNSVSILPSSKVTCRRSSLPSISKLSPGALHSSPFPCTFLAARLERDEASEMPSPDVVQVVNVGDREAVV
jgi:hypothetical protein